MEQDDKTSAHIEDEWVIKARRDATELSCRIPGRGHEESPLDACRRIDRDFNHLDTSLADRLDLFHRNERAALLARHRENQLAEIDAAYQAGLDRTSDPNLRSGGRHARDEEKRLFLERIGDDPKLKEKAQQLVDKQTARYTAVSHEIGRVQDQTMEGLGLTRQEEQEQEQEQEPEQAPLMYRRQAQSRTRGR